MTRQQYNRFLKLPQDRKKTFIQIAKREGMSKDEIYWLELGYKFNDPKVRTAMFDHVYSTLKK
jgi:transcriptional regulator with XRE-family HTH domain